MADAFVETIDLGYLGLRGAAAAFLVRAGAPILIECGPAATIGTLLEALAQRDLRPRDLAALLVTHVHLDHAGAAGHFAREGVPVFVHPLGARHLVEPERLIASSRRVHGDRFDRHYGEPLPCPEALVRSVEEGARAAWPGGSARAIATPGHAKHHHAWLLELGGERLLFAGDAAAMIAPQSRAATPDGGGLLSLPTPPPDFDREAWRRSIQAMRRERADRLYLTHFGEAPSVDAHLDAVEERLGREVDEALHLLRSAPEEERIPRYRAWLEGECRARGVEPAALPEAARGAFLGASLARMNLEGVRRWMETAGPA